MTLASLIIPSRAGASRLPNLLTALRAQTDPEWEAIVVVDGELDDSVEVVAANADLPARSILFPTNQGRSSALNAGFAAAVGEVLIRCDDDLVPGPDFIAGHKAAHQGPPNGAIGLCKDAPSASWYSRTYGLDNQERQFRAALGVGPPGVASEPQDELPRWRFWGGNVSVTREVWEQVGPYDVRYRRYGWEDVDWGYRLHQTGYPIEVRPELTATHLGAATTTAAKVERALYAGAASTTFTTIHGVELPRPELSSWNTLIRAAAAVGTPKSLASLATALDRHGERLPSPVASKSIAFLVETAAVLGRKNPTAAKRLF